MNKHQMAGLDYHAKKNGKPRDQLVPYGELVAERVYFSGERVQYMLSRAYCRGHVRLLDDLWTEEVLVVAIPLHRDDPRIPPHMRNDDLLLVRPHPSEIDAALQREQEIIAFCREKGRSDE